VGRNTGNSGSSATPTAPTDAANKIAQGNAPVKNPSTFTETEKPKPVD